MAIVWVGIGLAAAGLLSGVAGNMQAGKEAKKQGERVRALGEFEAAQLEQNAGQQIAAAQRAGMEEERKFDLMQSRALALAAASGGGASDPTVIKIISDLAGEGAYRKSVALYQGEENARQMRLAAVARRMEGEAGFQGGVSAQRAYNINAASGALSGAGSYWARRYGSGTGSMTTNSPGATEPTVEQYDYPQ